MNQIESARKNIYTEEMEFISQEEGVDISALRKDIARGYTVILRHNVRKTEKFCAIGRNLKTKVNVNIGTSPSFIDLHEEEEKINVSEKYGADALMDLSSGGDLDKIRKFVLDKTKLPVGTVPIYEAAIQAREKYGDINSMTEEDIFKAIEKQAGDGVDFMTVHCGVTLSSVKLLAKRPRITGVVSRGGAILCSWMKKNNKENPLFTQYDRLLDIAYKYDIVLSLGDGMRPGCIEDASDKTQFSELKILSKLAEKALQRGAQVMIEGPGHVPINQIERNIKLQKKWCNGAPFYVLGPLVTDIAPGYDHITSAIGGAIAGFYGADFLCYVTPAEHLRLPTVSDVQEGLIAAKIAAHAADISKLGKSASQKDRLMSIARSQRDWKKQIELSIDPDKAKKYRESRKPNEEDVCTMCGEFCSMKLMEECNLRV